MESAIAKKPKASINQIKIIKLDAIPALRQVEQDGKIYQIGELHDFQWHEALKNFMPAASEFSIGWVHLKENEVLNIHTHPMQSMMMFYKGNGQLIGQRQQQLKDGDVIVVPPGCEHGFVGGPDGLHGFSIQFGPGIYTDPNQAQVIFKDDEFNLEKLVALNQQRLQKFSQTRFFEIIKDGTLKNLQKRQAFLNNLQIWVDGNQLLMFTRQATAKGSEFEKTFLEHLQEEIGHDELHKANNPDKTAARDTILEAITNWVSYQMLVLDNIEKAAIIHLVIENAANYYVNFSEPYLAEYIGREYFDTHLEHDGEHSALGAELLKNQTPQTYLRLKEIVEEAWDMIDAMVDRVAYLTDQA